MSEQFWIDDYLAKLLEACSSGPEQVLLIVIVLLAGLAALRPGALLMFALAEITYFAGQCMMLADDYRARAWEYAFGKEPPVKPSKRAAQPSAEPTEQSSEVG